MMPENEPLYKITYTNELGEVIVSKPVPLESAKKMKRVIEFLNKFYVQINEVIDPCKN